jgi:transcriptional regulator with XRE-family HTH domain
MENPRGLSVWVNSKIDKNGNADYRSGRDFARAFKLDNKTVSKLMRDEPVERTTLQKLAKGLKMATVEEFTEFLLQFAKDQDSQTEIAAKIKSTADQLSPQNQRAVWALIETMLNENAG